MSVKDRMRFESMLAFHAAPTLMGMKCASLCGLSAQEYNFGEVARLFAENYFGERINACFIKRSSQRMLIYVYDTALLERRLSDKKVRKFLSGYGYDISWNAKKCMDRLCERLVQSDFPHEIGIFLGYPLEDVKGFIANCGQRCKYCGVWKVYGDVERAKAMFECYEQCRVRLCRELENGKQLRFCVA